MIKNYTEEEKAYDEIIDNLKEVFECMNLENAIQVFMACNYVIKNGYLSKNKQYVYSSKREHINNKYGTSIMDGTGVCLNESEILNQLYKKLGYNSCLVTSNITFGTTNLKTRLIPNNIEKEELNSTLKYEKISKITGDHCCVYVKDDHYNYIYDTTNYCTYKIVQPNLAKKINGEGNIKLKLFSSFLVGLDYKLIRKINENVISNKVQTNDIDNFKINAKKAIIKCEKYKEVFELFYEYNKFKINQIADSVNELKKAK